MRASLQPMLDLLDEGLRLYRRGFVGFVLLVALWLIPIAIGIGLSIAVVQFWFWPQSGLLLLLLAWMLLLVPLAVYLIGGLSRATLAVQQKQPIRVGQALAIPPLRAVGMGCYGIVLYFITNILFSIVSMACFCPLYLVIIMGLSGIDAFSGEAGDFGRILVIIVGVILALLVFLFYGASLVMSGATYSVLVYGLQPFALERNTLGETIQHSIDLMTYRFGTNLLAFVLTSTISGALMVAVTIAIGVLLPLPLFMALGEESLVAQGVSASAWLLGFIIVLPPMPIWMVLLYQRNVVARYGTDLAERIGAVGQRSAVSNEAGI